MVALKEKKIGKNNLELKTQIFDMEKTVVTAAESEVRGKLMVFLNSLFLQMTQLTFLKSVL